MFFFFQAEDGIRDGHVTGVQTCALPILPGVYRYSPDRIFEAAESCLELGVPVLSLFPNIERSEERRVGKECRSRWARDYAKKANGESRKGRCANETTYNVTIT